MRIPIACSLNESSARAQLEEWRRLLSRPSRSAVRISPTELALPLRDEPGQVEVIVRLAQREKACCPFFDFKIHIDPAGAVLHISVPSDAVVVLDDLAGAAYP